MTTIRTAVVGVGVQGQRHAEKFAALPDAELIAVIDRDQERARQLAAELGCSAAGDISDLLGDVQAVAISAPTSTHFDIAVPLLENGIHLLIEKPITTTVEEAQHLVELAEAKSLVLQVGHQERFNPATVALGELINQPQFIESNRIAPYRPRALDVSVVLDLMIHDIDLIHSFVQSPMAHVDAVGRSIFSDSLDVANARIRFENGCIANVTGSRVSLKTERSLRIFQEDSYISADLHNKTVSSFIRKSEGPVMTPEDIATDKQTFGDSDAMMDQTKAFLESIAGGAAPLVSGRTGMEALKTAVAIGDLVGASTE